MQRKVMRFFGLLPLIFLCSPALHAKEQEKRSEMTIDGKKAVVFFNDGDTFKIIEGEHKNGRVRVQGINTLESYGPVHEWHNNDVYELYDVAKDATQVVREGAWTCTMQKERDSYGRFLAICDDLAKVLIEKGLAHAYSVDETSASKKYLGYQKTAQEAGLGMWRDGIPQYIITSLHSVAENEMIGKKRAHKTYNRWISTKDGSSKMVEHEDEYTTCQKVCIEQDTSCMVYVPYEVRYGEKRPDCLRMGKH